MSKSVLILVIFLGVLAFRFEEYLIARNYTLFAHVPCDASNTVCFSNICDYESDPECTEEIFSKVQISAREAPSCVVENNCDANICSHVSCIQLSCNSDNTEDYEKCSSPESNA